VAEVVMKTVGRVTLALILCGGIAFAAFESSHFVSSAKPASAPSVPAIPVVIGAVTSEDFPITYDGIGTVQAYNTVTVRARVDGTLQEVRFKEGQDVKAGDVLAIIDPRPFQAALDQAVANKARDEAQLANAKLDLKRFVDLKDFASRQSVDTQSALVSQLQAAVKSDQALIENAQVQLSYTTIASPIDGRTGVRLVDPGNMVRASEGAALLVVTQMEPIFVTFTLPQEELDAVRMAETRGKVPVEAYKHDEDTLLSTGELAVIDNEIDTATGTIRIKATFANKDRRLWPGEFVNARVVTDTKHDATVVPAQAVQRGPNGLFVYVVKPDQTVDMRSITAGGTVAGMTLVKQGLGPGEKIILDGQYKVQPGVKVQPITHAEKTASAG
jgi:membrane fusion protein, multidrug efflux system